MKNMKNNIVSGIVFGVLALIVVTVGFLIVKPTILINTVNSAFGAVPVLNSPIEVNGMKVFYERKGLITSTTTVCAIKSPAATSTLTFASIRYYTSTSTASRTTIAKAATAFATTTLISKADLGANAFGTLVASTTGNGGLTFDGNTVFAPNNYLVFSMAGGVGTFSPTGKCQATFIEN